MYHTCLFCTRDLGRNDVVESFPVGRRLAFDGDKGRLWVVCPTCERWNLTPLEQRWEAIEQAEQLYRGTRQRVATENIGLARAPDGTALVRIGRPQRPEMAAWRYGDTFGRRRHRAVAAGVMGATAVGGAALLLPVGGVAVGVVSAVVGSTLHLAFMLTALGARTPAGLSKRWIADGTGQHLLITPNELPHVRLAAATTEEGWQLRVPYQTRRDSLEPRLRDLLANTWQGGEATLTGAAAREAVRRLLPVVNGWGAPKSQVQEAVRALEEWRGPERAFAEAAARVREYGAKQTFGDTGSLQHLPRPIRLALEMAAHEEQERRALESELKELEAAWREAEEIAAIADDLLIAPEVRTKLDRLKRSRQDG